MPITLRDAQHIDTPVTLYNEEIGEENIQELELWKDELPQPYRRIDKILNDIFDSAWEIIEHNETQNTIEKNKVRPLKFENLFQLENLEGISSICSSTDENEGYLFAALKTSIVVIDASSLTIVDQVQLNQQINQINSISCSKINNDSIFLIVVKTDADSLIMYLFVNDKLILIPSPIDNDTDKRFKKIQISDNTDYLAFLIESRLNSNDPTYIEVYKFQKEIWLSQIETLIEKLNQKVITSSENSLQDDLSNQQQTQPEIAIKFQLFCKIKPHLLNGKINSNSAVNLQVLQKAAENSEIVGLGINHFFSKIHLDLKQQLLEKIYNVQLSDINGGSHKDINFKFMYSNRLTSINHDNHTNDLPSSLMVWVEDSNQIYFYQFGKITKDLESKIEYCFPFTSEVHKVITTKLAPLVAVCLKNNNIVVLDTNAGIVRKTVHLNVNSIRDIHFIPNPQPHQHSYSNLKTQCILLSDDGRIFSIDCSLLDDKKEIEIYKPKYMNNDDKFDFISPCANLPNLILTASVTGKKYMLDVSNGNLVCELANPEDTRVASNQNFVFACQSKVLFMICNFPGNESSKLFAHSVRSIPKLNDYFLSFENGLFSNSTFIINGHIKERTKNLLKNQSIEQFARKERLNVFWKNLKDQKN